MAADKVELRGMCPLPVAQVIDALALAANLDRNSYVVRVLAKHCREELHRANVLVRATQGNLLAAEGERNESDWAPLT